MAHYTKVNCESYNVIYVQTISTSEKLVAFFKFRLSERKVYIINKDETHASGSYFNLPGRNLGHLMATILEQVNKNCE